MRVLSQTNLKAFSGNRNLEPILSFYSAEMQKCCFPHKFLRSRYVLIRLSIWIMQEVLKKIERHIKPSIHKQNVRRDKLTIFSGFPAATSFQPAPAKSHFFQMFVNIFHKTITEKSWDFSIFPTYPFCTTEYSTWRTWIFNFGIANTPHFKQRWLLREGKKITLGLKAI